MSRLPKLRFESLSWQLPLSVAASDLLAQSLVCRASGDRSGAWQAIRDVLLQDPPTFIWGVLSWSQSLGFDHAMTLQFEEFVDWMVDHVPALLASSDTAVIHTTDPEDTSHRSHWEALRQEKGFNPVQWQTCGRRWLEACGPTVPEAWSHRWPRFAHVSCANELSTATGAAELSLPLLAKQLEHAQHLQHCFTKELDKAKLDALYQFAYGLTHEINNPLSNIYGRAQCLLHQGAATDQLRHLQAIGEQAMRAHEMLADLMFVARPPQRVLQTVDLVALLRTVGDETREACANKQIRLLGPQGLTKAILRLDPQMIGDAFRAVLQNAIQAVEIHGIIGLHVDRKDHHVRVRVQDNGAGLTALAMRHAFDPFYSGREAGRGLGMGLCKTKRIIQMHQGEVSIKSHGLGCVMTILLPAEQS